MTDPSDLPPDLLGRIPLFAELQRVLSWSGGPVNWDLARQIAVAAAAAAESAHTVSDADQAAVAEDARVAELWLADATHLEPPPAAAPPRALTPAQWAEHACGSYRELIDPLASKVSSALGEQAGSVGADEAAAFGIEASQIRAAISQMAPLFLGVQSGNLIGSLAKDILGQHDLPLPSDDDGAVTVLVPAVDSFASSYGLDRREAILWTTLHEAAHRLLFETFSVRAQFFAAYLDYVASIDVDIAGMMQRMQSLEISDPSRLEETLASGELFDAESSPATAAALARIDRLVAMLESFADRAVDAATAGRLPAASRLAEAAARHRTGRQSAQALRAFIGIGPAEDARRATEKFADHVLGSASWTALGRLWEDFPTESELSDPGAWLRRTS